MVNFHKARVCARCDADLPTVVSEGKSSSGIKSRLAVRALVCLAVCVAVLLGFYLSLIASAKSLTYDQETTVRAAIQLLEQKGFDGEAMLLDNFTVYRSNDNWLNASVEKENAYAATNFPFEIMTLYEDFFKYPIDDTERAAILLHEARHLKGKDEKDAYEFVWRNRKKLGWVEEKYANFLVWQDVRRQTRIVSPNLFVCDSNKFGDCTE